jgi:hypothetical protein
MARFIPKNPIGSRCQAIEQTLTPQEIDIGKRGEEEKAFDASGETNQVQKELLAFFACLYFCHLVHAAHPLKAELSLSSYGRDIFYR